MKHIMIDVECDGPLIGTHSMISFGAVVIDKGLEKRFYAELKPIGDQYIEEALSVSGFSREKTLTFKDPKEVMIEFEQWLKSLNDRIVFWSDNNGFDFAWMNWYFLTFIGANPFGHSSNNLRNVFNGMNKSMKQSFKHLRKTKHSHNALDDALGNAEAMVEMMNMGMKF